MKKKKKEIKEYIIADCTTIGDKSFVLSFNEAAGTYCVCNSDVNFENIENEKIYLSCFEAFHDYLQRMRKCYFEKASKCKRVEDSEVAVGEEVLARINERKDKKGD